MTNHNTINQSVTTSVKGVEHHNVGTIDPEFSKRITALRFVMAVFVVFIHNKLSNTIHFADGDFVVDMPLGIRIIHDTFSNYWGSIAVPTFFIISGYLFFAKPKPIAVTLRLKFKGIFIPYLLWIVLAILMFYIAQSFEFSKPYFAQHENIIRNWNFCDYFKAFIAWDIKNVDDNGLNTPFVSQFWYIRDLIIMMTISPLIKILAEKIPATFIIGVTTLRAAEMLQIVNIQYGITTALFYFTLGYYAVKYIGRFIKFLDAIRWRDFIMAYLISFALTVLSNMNSLTGSCFIGWFNLLFTVCLAIKVAGVACKNENLFEKLSYLSGYSFWVFAAHLPFTLPVMRKLSVKVIPMHGVWILVQFFGVVILCVVFLLILGIAVKKYLPKVFALLNGGR